MADHESNRRSWTTKFRHAIRGLRVGSRGQSSFLVHLPVACFVLAAAAQLKVTTLEWCVLLVCITVVLMAELMNTALEMTAKAVTDQYDERIRDALDIASAAVLVAAIGAAIVGVLILGLRLGVVLGWWPFSYVG